MTYVDIINTIEVLLWPALGIVVLSKTLKAPIEWRSLGYVAAVTLMIFGITDVVELYTKAWWRPWWLLVWKGTCITILVSCAVIRSRKLRLTNPNNV